MSNPNIKPRFKKGDPETISISRLGGLAKKGYKSENIKERVSKLETILLERSEIYGYYVYVHRNIITNEVFYVGKGKDTRFKDCTGRGKYWENYVVKNENSFIAEILYDNLIEFEAFAIETRLIKAYGSQLVNIDKNSTLYKSEVKSEIVKLNKI